MPILGRIDVIEQAGDQPDFVKPDSADLKPSSTVYTFAAGDVLQISIPNLMQTGATEQADRIVDQSGYVQLPVIGKVLAAGLDTEQFEEAIVQKLKPVMGDGAKVFVMLKEGRSFQYRVLGSVDQPGIFGLTRPDFRLLDALATARGASVNTARILITRTTFEDDQKADYEKQAAVEDAKKYNKPKITKFEEFDDQTKNIYLTIASELKKLNLDQNFKLIATGSRVTGKWKKDDEADELAAKFNIKVKYSDYDFITDAINIPDLQQLASQLGVKKLNKIAPTIFMITM